VRPGLTPEPWWSWNADLPAEMRHLSSGFVLTPLLYAASENRPSRLPPGDGVVFGPRAIGDGEIRLELSLAGTRLDWRYRLDGRGGLGLDWRAEAFGEWGLRFWVLLCVHGGPEAHFRYDRACGKLEGRSGARRLSLSSAKAPLLVTGHDGLEALEAELVDKGYFYLGSRAEDGHFLALRFNLEEAPDMRVEISIDGAAAPEPSDPVEAATSELQDALQAVHDVMSWNDVYDFVNARPYTALSRFWNSRKFGGFGVWLDDVLFNAWLWGHFDMARARDNLEAVFAWQTEAGNFPCLVTGNDAWLDRSQPPIGAFVVWSLYARSGDRDLLERAYPALLRNYYWWWARRRLGETGLLAYGTSLDVGDGLYKGTKLAAKDESTMDNSPLHDLVPFDQASGLLLAADVGLNSLAALDGEVLAMMARTLGQDSEAGELEREVAAHKARIADWLWDESRQVFANRLLDGGFVTPLAPTSFYPLLAGIGTPEQHAALVERHLRPEDKFGGAFGLPSVTRDDPAYGDNVYWRGRIWGPLNFWTYQGLRRAGLDGEAAALAEKSRRLFAQGWQARHCGENYNAETGEILDQPDSDCFYSWGALLPALAVSQHLDVTPWAGWSVLAPPPGARLGPVLTPAGRLFLSADETAWRLERADGRVLLASNLAGRLTRLSLAGPQPEALLPPVERDEAWIAFPGHDVSVCDLSGQKLRRRDGRFALPRSDEPVRLNGGPGGG
jgi:putative isomerase